MKFKRYLFIPTLLAVCLILASCGFVSYVRYSNDEKSPDFDERLTEYIEELEALSSLDLYREAERLEYRAALLDAKNELGECETLDELDEVFEKHLEILGSIPTDFQMTIASFVEAVEQKVSLDDYREDERASVIELITEYSEQIRGAQSKDDAERFFREFEVEVFQIKTDAEYYAEELTKLKDSLKKDFSKKPIYSKYESNELHEIESLISKFEAALDGVDTKESASQLFDDFCETLLEIPTTDDLNEIRKNTLILEWQEKFESFYSKYSLTSSNEITAQRDELRKINALNEINLSASDFLIKKSKQIGAPAISDFRENCKIYLENIAIATDYRDNEKSLLVSLLHDANADLTAAASVDAMSQAFESSKEKILSLPTNDELWTIEDEKFLTDLKSLYGNKILELPEKMYEASSYDELAAIIDYYAFYQTSHTEFLRDTFRVKLLYTYKSAQWEINEVYWHCELLRGAVGITGRIEKTSSGEYLVITLIPYAMASTSTAKEPYEADRYNNQTSYKQSSTATYTKRPEDFEDFAYLSTYEKSLSGIWNSHQLWYAFEHEYIPEVVEGSAAERVLERSKELLRELILDGMTDEEKIFAIFSWYGRNVQFDYGYDEYLYPEDREHFPDVLVSTLNSFHAEGALFDNIAVCESFAKSMLIMLRMEGIECYRIFVHGYSTNAINNLGHDGYGSHALLAIKMSDGKFYVSDAYEAWQHNTKLPKYHQFLIPWDLHSTYPDAWSLIFEDLVYGDTILPSVMENLVYNGTRIFATSIQDIQKIITDFNAESDEKISVSILQYDKLNSELNILDAIKESKLSYYVVTHDGLTEYIVYK